jgi:hypothetical protein
MSILARFRDWRSSRAHRRAIRERNRRHDAVIRAVRDYYDRRDAGL